MGLEIAAACLRRPGFKLAPFALTGPNMPKKVEVDDGRGGAPVTVELYGPERLEELKERAAKYEKGKLVFIDFTHPSAVNGNAKLYGPERLEELKERAAKYEKG